MSDIVIKKGDTLHPIEIKKKSYASKKDIKAFKKLDSIPGHQRGKGAVICISDTWMPIDEDVVMLPVSYV